MILFVMYLHRESLVIVKKIDNAQIMWEARFIHRKYRKFRKKKTFMKNVV